MWSTGQDSARVIKERLRHLAPGIECFLDVDNLDDISRLEDYVAASHVVLIFLSSGYLGSTNCLRELRAAVGQHKPVVVVRETDREKGSMTVDEASALLEKDEEAREMLFGGEAPVEWYRIAEFQSVSLLQIARHLAPTPALARELYIPGGPTEQLSRKALLPPSPAGGCHLFISPHNEGAMDLARELSAAFSSSSGCGSKAHTPLLLADDSSALDNETVHAMLLLLDSATWFADASDDAACARKDALSRDVTNALRRGFKVLMAHECGHPERSVAFGTFFDHTPGHLLDCRMYSDIAVALNGDAGSEHRAVSLALVGLNLLNATGTPRVPRTDIATPRALMQLAPALPRPSKAAKRPSATSAASSSSSAGALAALASSSGAGGEVSTSTSTAAKLESESVQPPRMLSKAERTRARRESLTAADSTRSLVGHKEGAGRETFRHGSQGDSKCGGSSSQGGNCAAEGSSVGGNGTAEQSGGAQPGSSAAAPLAAVEETPHQIDVAAHAASSATEHDDDEIFEV